MFLCFLRIKTKTYSCFNIILVQILLFCIELSVLGLNLTVVYTFRPSCDGHKYYIVNGAPRTVATYKEFFSQYAEAYRCLCQGTLGGDDCKGCNPPFEFEDELGRCRFCHCTDLSRSRTCHPTTGQCDCEETVHNATIHNPAASRTCVSLIRNSMV